MYTSLHLFFDIIIAGALIISGLMFWFIFRDAFIAKKGRLFKYRLISLTLLIISGATFLTIFYGSFIEPEIIVINRQNVTLFGDGGTPVKIALVSDFHAGAYVKEGFILRIVKKIEKENPDLVLLAGDLVDSDSSEVKYLKPLKELADQFPTYAVLGNHDSGGGNTNKDYYTVPERIKSVTDFLTASGIKVLDNTGGALEIHGYKIFLGGVSEYLNRTADVAAAFANAPKDAKKILLAHNPDIIYQAMRQRVNIVLSAHTHGGQIRLPFYGAVGSPFTELGDRFDKGWFDFGNTKLFITSGIGETGTRARLFDPPEIVILDIN